MWSLQVIERLFSVSSS